MACWQHMDESPQTSCIPGCKWWEAIRAFVAGVCPCSGASITAVVPEHSAASEHVKCAQRCAQANLSSVRGWMGSKAAG